MKDWLDLKFYRLRGFIERLRRFRALAPHLWRGNDWEFDSSLVFFGLSLARLLPALSQSDSGRKVEARQLKEVLRLLKEYMGEAHVERAFEYHNEVWGKREDVSFPSEGHPGFLEMETYWERATNPDLHILAEEDIGEMLEAAMRAHQSTWAAIWKGISKSMQSWWI